jgi:hypothetical protein
MGSTVPWSLSRAPNATQVRSSISFRSGMISARAFQEQQWPGERVQIQQAIVKFRVTSILD